MLLHFILKAVSSYFQRTKPFCKTHCEGKKRIWETEIFRSLHKALHKEISSKSQPHRASVPGARLSSSYMCMGVNLREPCGRDWKGLHGRSAQGPGPVGRMKLRVHTFPHAGKPDGHPTALCLTSSLLLRLWGRGGIEKLSWCIAVHINSWSPH